MHAALTDQMSGADDHQVILVIVEQRLDFGHPLAVARHQHRLIELRDRGRVSDFI